MPPLVTMATKWFKISSNILIELKNRNQQITTNLIIGDPKVKIEKKEMLLIFLFQAGILEKR